MNESDVPVRLFHPFSTAFCSSSLSHQLVGQSSNSSGPASSSIAPVSHCVSTAPLSRTFILLLLPQDRSGRTVLSLSLLYSALPISVSFFVTLVLADFGRFPTWQAHITRYCGILRGTVDRSEVLRKSWFSSRFFRELGFAPRTGASQERFRRENEIPLICS